MKKLIKFVLVIALIIAVIFVAIKLLDRFGLFKEKVPGIEKYDWKLVVAKSMNSDECEYPNLHGVEGVGDESSRLVDIKLYAKDGIVYIEKDGVVVAESGIIDGMRDENNNYRNDGSYIVNFDGVECNAFVKITKYVEWNTEQTGFDGNRYGEYCLELLIVNSEYEYNMQFFSID